MAESLSAKWRGNGSVSVYFGTQAPLLWRLKTSLSALEALAWEVTSIPLEEQAETWSAAVAIREAAVPEMCSGEAETALVERSQCRANRRHPVVAGA